jgi:hypothetical protein
LSRFRGTFHSCDPVGFAIFAPFRARCFDRIVQSNPSGNVGSITAAGGEVLFLEKDWLDLLVANTANTVLAVCIGYKS